MRSKEKAYNSRAAKKREGDSSTAVSLPTSWSRYRGAIPSPRKGPFGGDGANSTTVRYLKSPAMTPVCTIGATTDESAWDACNTNAENAHVTQAFSANMKSHLRMMTICYQLSDTLQSRCLKIKNVRQ